MIRFIVKDLYDIEDNLYIWSLDEMLQEINRDTSDEWSNYDYNDWIEGWFEWVEGQAMSLIGLICITDYMKKDSYPVLYSYEFLEMEVN